MANIKSTWTPDEYAGLLRERNPELKHWGAGELSAKAALDYPDRFTFDGETLTEFHPDTMPASEFTARLKAKNPGLKSLSHAEIIKQASEDHPGVFSMGRGRMVTVAAPKSESPTVALSQWGAKEFADKLRASNSELANASDDDLIARAMEDYPGRYARSADGLISLNSQPQQHGDGLLKRSTPMPAPTHRQWGEKTERRINRRRELARTMTHGARGPQPFPNPGVDGQSVIQAAQPSVQEGLHPQQNSMGAVSDAEHQAGLKRAAIVQAKDAEIERLVRENVEAEAALSIGMSRTSARAQGQSEEFDFHVNQQTAARMKTLNDALARNPALRELPAQELANNARDISDLENDPALLRNLRQGAWSGSGHIKQRLGNAVDVINLAANNSIPGAEKVRDALRDAARRDQTTVMLSGSLHPDENKFTNELARGVGNLAFAEGPVLYLTTPLKAAQLPILGGLSGEDKGALATAKGVVLGYLYHRGWALRLLVWVVSAMV